MLLGKSTLEDRKNVRTLGVDDDTFVYIPVRGFRPVPTGPLMSQTKIHDDGRREVTSTVLLVYNNRSIQTFLRLVTTSFIFFHNPKFHNLLFNFEKSTELRLLFETVWRSWHSDWQGSYLCDILPECSVLLECSGTGLQTKINIKGWKQNPV